MERVAGRQTGEKSRLGLQRTFRTLPQDDCQTRGPGGIGTYLVHYRKRLIASLPQERTRLQYLSALRYGAEINLALFVAKSVLLTTRKQPGRAK